MRDEWITVTRSRDRMRDDEMDNSEHPRDRMRDEWITVIPSRDRMRDEWITVTRSRQNER